MRLRSADTLAGVPILRVREFFRRTLLWSWDLEELVARLGEPEDVCRALIQKLIVEGYIEPSKEFRGSDTWTATIKGSALAGARATPPVTRATAHRHLDAFLSRVRELNASTHYLYRVDKVVLFGSFVDESQMYVGDVDLAVDLAPRAKNPVRHRRLSDARSWEAAKAGRHFSNIVDRLCWSETEVWLFLQSRSRVLSLTSMRTEVLEDAPTRVIFERSLHALGKSHATQMTYPSTP